MTSMPTCLGHCMPDPLVLRGIVRILKIRAPFLGSSYHNGHSTLGIKLGPLFMESRPRVTSFDFVRTCACFRTLSRIDCLQCAVYD